MLYGRSATAASEASTSEPYLADGPEAATAGQRRADAIGLIAESVLRHNLDAAAYDADERSGDHEVVKSAREAGVAEDAGVVKDGAAAVARHDRTGPRSTGTVRSARPKTPTTVRPAERFQVVLHVDAEALRVGSDTGQSVLASGVRVPAETSRRLACDASRVVMTHDAEGSVLGVGRRTRTVPPAIRRALNHRDQGCRFPGCGLRYCDAHHITHWADGGATKLDNLVMLCRRHHRAVHEEGFRVQLADSGQITFLRPDGRPLPDVPESPDLPTDPVASLAAKHCASGLEIDPTTALSGWMGERLDLDFTLLTLRGPQRFRDATQHDGVPSPIAGII